ncbi:tyrosine-type recombinase/integrase [Sphingobacterium endophyticum]|uniref:tyrosine-type recombinase/integrase n=1 Tax=Sphingobacterium endophyticum TaxID=2546448 RepID=UPI0012E17F4D|nr:site-specific integrase [Sphingobacterium endophyticum]
MYTDPIIVQGKDIKTRSYIYYYFNGKRYKEYTGKKLGLHIFPNSAKTLKEQRKLLDQLQFEFLSALKNGVLNPNSKVENFQVKEILIEALNRKLSENLSKSYKSDLKLTLKAFLNVLPKHFHTVSILELKVIHIEKFLNLYRTSNTTFSNKRINLMAIFSEASRILDRDIDVVRKVKPKKSIAKLHEIYSKEELKTVLDYLKETNQYLYLCCLLVYGTFLRPHNEVRVLNKKHFNGDYSIITLSGVENKSRVIRTVNVPLFVQKELKPILDQIKRDDNIFSLSNLPFNDDYFRTLWTRSKKVMLEKGIIRKEQTIYSFRHTAAINVYKKTKDLHILQQLLGHSDMIVTLKYLRGLGVHNTEELRSVMPEL